MSLSPSNSNEEIYDDFENYPEAAVDLVASMLEEAAAAAAAPKAPKAAAPKATEAPKDAAAKAPVPAQKTPKPAAPAAPKGAAKRPASPPVPPSPKAPKLAASNGLVANAQAADDAAQAAVKAPMAALTAAIENALKTAAALAVARLNNDTPTKRSRLMLAVSCIDASILKTDEPAEVQVKSEPIALPAAVQVKMERTDDNITSSDVVDLASDEHALELALLRFQKINMLRQ
jgi:hypothetical protein